MSETDGETPIKAELPGMDEKDIEVALDEDVLTIRAERKNEREEKKQNYHVSEMSYGSFQRRIPLGADKVKARFKRDVLTLTLPKAEQARPNANGRFHLAISAQSWACGIRSRNSVTSNSRWPHVQRLVWPVPASP